MEKRENWLENLIENLETVKTELDKSKKNAGVSLILKFKSLSSVEEEFLSSTKTKKEKIQFIQQKKESIELLFTKRTTRESDRWSGQVAFPGGKHERGETMKQTAEREVLEEIGIDITNEENYLYLGRLKKQQTRDIFVFPFVYFSLKEKVQCKLQKDEIADAKWTPLEFFQKEEEFLQQHKKMLNFNLTHLYKNIGKFIPNFMLFNVSIEGIMLPDSKEFLRKIKNEDFILWGLTMKITNDFLSRLFNQNIQICRETLQSSNFLKALTLNFSIDDGYFVGFIDYIVP
eukprot:gene3896-7109_t